MDQICHNNIMVYHHTCSKVHRKCKGLRKAFHSNNHNIQIMVHHLSNILTHSRSSSCMPKNKEELLCHQLSPNKKGHNQGPHLSHNSSSLLNRNRLSKSKKNIILRPGCLSP